VRACFIQYVSRSTIYIDDTVIDLYMDKKCMQLCDAIVRHLAFPESSIVDVRGLITWGIRAIIVCYIWNLNTYNTSGGNSN